MEPHIYAIGTAKFLLCMLALIVFDCWIRIRAER